jgi:O-antigen/teichoic acid export membrane protein
MTEARVGMTSVLSRSLGGRLAVGLADSAISSAGNLGVSIIVAHAASLPEFGVFATAMLILILATMISRSAHGEVLILKSAEPDEALVAADRQRSTTSVIQLCTILGSTTVSVGVLIGLLSGAGFNSAVMTVIVSGSALPLLCLQEHLRWIEYARGSSHRALINNLLWTVSSIVALTVAVVALPGGIPAYVCLLLWAYTTVPGIVYALLRGRMSLRFGGRPEWLRLNRTLAAPLVMDLSLTQATAQGATLVVAALSRAVDMAFIRKGQIWMGPATVATMGLLSALQPILTQRAADKGDAAAVRLATAVGAVAGAAVLLYGLSIALLPPEMAQWLVGPGWAESRPFVWPLTILAAASIVGGCLGLAIRTSGLIRRQVRLRLMLAPVSVVGVALLTRIDGARAGMWALAAAAVVSTVAWSGLLAVRGQGRGRYVG